METRYHVKARARATAAVPSSPSSTQSSKEIHPRGVLLGSCGQGIANWATPHRVQRVQEDKAATLWRIPPTQSKADRGQPAAAETGWAHFSGTDISDPGGNFRPTRQLTNGNRNKTQAGEQVTNHGAGDR